MENASTWPQRPQRFGAGVRLQGMSFGHGPTSLSRPEQIAVIRTAHERGMAYFDTAEAYGPYASELLVGEAVSPSRDDVVLATKFGFDIKDNQTAGLNSRPEQIRKFAEDPSEMSAAFAKAPIRQPRLSEAHMSFIDR